VFELRDGENTIGRTKANDVFVLHKSLSRQHARLQMSDGAWLIEDLGSKNGTFVDGVRVERRDLGEAHYIKCGDVVFSFVSEEKGSRLSNRPPQATTSPTLICDVQSDPALRSLSQLLTLPSHGQTTPGATALNLRAATAEERAREKLQILLKVSEMLSSPASIDEVLATILDLAFQILDVDRGTVLTLDEVGALQPRVSRTRSDQASEAEGSYSHQIVDYVIREGHGALFANTQADPRIDGSGSILSQSICASMCAPLKPRDDRPVFGVLYVDNVTRPDRFTQEDLEFLTAFANQAAVAVDNAMLSARLAEEAVARNSLLRFFPPAAIDAIMGSGRLEAIETVATALFCDISGYTSLSAKLAPREVIQLLNAYFPRMADVVFRYEGTLEKYIGDALLAVWGAPIRTEHDAERAVAAAIDMQRAMGNLNLEWRRRCAANGIDPGPELAIHIGINTGPVAAGNIGTDQFLQYATIGDATNVASRICGVANAAEIVIDEATFAKLPEGRFDTEALPPTPVKGKEQPLSLHRVRWQRR
jgi:adenylate cyclase